MGSDMACSRFDTSNIMWQFVRIRSEKMAQLSSKILILAPDICIRLVFDYAGWIGVIKSETMSRVRAVFAHAQCKHSSKNP